MASQAYSNYDPSTAWSDANLIQKAIDQNLLRINTVLPCEIISKNTINLTNYDIKPLVNRVDAQGKSIEYEIIVNIPAQKIMGGNAGIIIEYKDGDKVCVGFCQRDITTTKKNWTRGRPASLRKFYLLDGIILGKLDNNLPTTYVKITDAGIEIQAQSNPINVITTGDTSIQANKATITASEVDINSSNINLGGSSGAYVLTTNTKIIAPSEGGECTITPGTTSTTTKAV